MARNRNERAAQEEEIPNPLEGERVLTQEELEQQALDRLDQLIDNFQKRKPPTFNGTGGPDAAEEWIRGTEKVFGRMRCNPHEKVVCATYQLEGEADDWWDSTRRTMTQEQYDALTWEQFRGLYYTKYITPSYRFRKENKFWNLRQGGRTVEEYDRLFNHLSRYAPEHVNTDVKKANRFRQGLRSEIAVPLATHDELTYAQVLSKALNIEARLPKEDRKPNPEKRKWEATSQGQTSNPDSKGKKQWTGSNSQNQQGRQNPLAKNRNAQEPKPYCTNCDKNHYGPCKKGNPGCYNCGEIGHIKKFCPKLGA